MLCWDNVYIWVGENARKYEKEQAKNAWKNEIIIIITGNISFHRMIIITRNFSFYRMIA